MVLVPDREPDFIYRFRHHFWLEPEMIRYDKEKDEAVSMKYSNNRLCDADDIGWGYRDEIQQMERKFRLEQEVERILLGEEDETSTK